jgi:hypothetical protein
MRRFYKPQVASLILKACEVFTNGGWANICYADIKHNDACVTLTISDNDGNPFVDYYFEGKGLSTCYKREILAHRKDLIDKGIYNEKTHMVYDLPFAK